MLQIENSRRAFYLATGLLVAIIPVVYFHNGLVTEYYYSKAVWGNFFAPMLLALWLLLGLRQQSLVLPKSRIFVPLLLFLAWCLASLLWVRNPNKAWDLIVIVGAGPFLALAVATFVQRREEIIHLLYLILLAAVAVTVYGFFQYFEVVYLPKDQYGDADPSTTIGLTNFAVEYMSVFFLTGPLLLLIEQRRWLRSLLIVASVCVITYLLISRNRAGFLALVAEVIALLFLLFIVAKVRAKGALISGRLVAITAVVIVSSAAIVFTQTTVGERVAERFIDLVNIERVDDQTSLLSALLERAQRDASVRFRVQTWYQCLLALFPAYPLYGVGLANAEIEFPRHFTPFLEGMTIRHNTRVVHLHNEYVQVFSDLGIIGFVLLFWLLTQLCRSAFAGFSRIQNRQQLLLWLAVHVGFFGYLVEMFFAFPLQIPTSSIYFFVFVGLSIATNRYLRHAAGVPAEALYFVLPVSLAVTRRVCFLAAILLLVWGGYTEVLAYHRLIGEVRNKEARVFRRANRLVDAERLLDEAIAHYPGMEGYYFDRGSIRLQNKNSDGALEDFMITAKLVPNYAAGRKQIGVLAAQAGRIELAIQEFKAVMDIYKSQRGELAETIGKLALQANRPDLAIPVLESLPAEIASHANLQRLLFQAYAQAANAASAIAIIERYPDLLKDVNVRTNYISLLFAIGRTQEAATQAKAFLAQHSELAEAWVLAAKADLASDPAASKKALTKALQLNPQLIDFVKRDRDFKAHPELASFIENL